MIHWKTEKRKLGELIPYENNPRKLTDKQKNDLKNSLEKFSLAEIPVINTDYQILAGHKRIEILLELEGKDHEIDVRIPHRRLSKSEAKEYLIRSNKNTGDWDFELLGENFDLEELKDWGFEEWELKIFDEPQKEEEKKPKKTTICPECGCEF